MGRGMRWVVLATLAVGTAYAPARAENPRISLKLEKTTAADAAAALSKAAGIGVELSAPQAFGRVPAAPPFARPTDNVRFDWTDTTFARALRQLCATYRLSPNRRPGGYTLYPSFAPAAPANRVGLVEKSSVRLFARGVSLSSNRGLRFVDDQLAFNTSNLSLELGCEMVDGDADTIAGLENVSARDDLGNLLVSEPGHAYYGYWGNQFPDEWRGSISFSGVHPRARKLQWVEGDLLVYRIYRPVKVEFPLPIADAGTQKPAGDVMVELSRFTPAAGGVPAVPGRRPVSGPTLQARVVWPGAARLPGPWGSPPTVSATLIGASGKSYSPASFGGGSRSGPDGATQELSLTFPPMDEPAVKAVVQWVEKAQPTRLFSFRMQNIPLPPEGVSTQRRAPRAEPPARPTTPPASERAYYQKDGGALRNLVQIRNQPAPGGTLSLGLSLKSNGAWSAIRWLDVDVDADGLGRLEALKPGAYRLLRVYHPRDAASELAGPGRWLNDEAQIDVAAGKEAAPPPLRWTPQVGERR